MTKRDEQYQEERLAQVEKAITTLNREMGELLGEVRGMKFMLGIGFGATVAIQLINLARGG